MKIIPFFTRYSVAERSIDHLKVAFVAHRLQHILGCLQELEMTVETSARYFLNHFFARRRGLANL